MKNKNFGVKVLVLMLCFAMALSCLFSCVSDEQMEEANTKLDTLENGKVDKETYAALDAFVKEIDVIAKAAVSTEKFEAALNTLNASIATKADAAKVSEDITAAKNALKEMIDANATADTATKESLEAALVKITALEGSVATKVALNEAVTGINATITANKQAVEAKIAEIETLVATKADKATVDAAIAELTATVAANKTAAEKAVNDAKAALEGQLTAVNAELDALTATVATNKTAAEKLVNDAKVALEGKITEANGKINDLAGVVENNNTALTKEIADLKTAITALQAADAENAKAVSDLKTAYETQVNELKATDAANKKALEDKLASDVAALTAKYNAEVDALKKADGDNTAAINALKADYEKKIAELTAADAANKKALEDKLAADVTALTTKYDAKVAELAAADAANKTALENKITEEIGKVNTTVTANAKAANDKIAALEAKVDTLTNDLNSKITALNNTVETKINNLKSELEAKINTLQESYDAFVSNTNTEITNIKALITTIQDQITTLHANSDSFAKEYQDATDELYNGEYSIDNFNAKVEKIVAEDYEETKYKEFEAAVVRLRFFLNRAITVDAIKGYFAELDAIINSMPTLVESLTEMLNAYTENAPEGERKYLTVNPDELKSINTVYEKIGAVDAELEALYQAITVAHANLVAANGAAEDVKANINTIATPIVYTTSEAAIVYAENAFDAYNTTYFADAEMTKYYGETSAATLVTNYEKLTGYRTYYNNLVDAAADKVNFKDIVLNYNTVRPLWNQLADIEDDATLYAEWLVEYNIDVVVDAASIATIYGGELELLDKAKTYATYMSGVYTDNGVEALVAQIAEYVSAEVVLYNTKETCDNLNTLRETVKAAIEAAFDYAADDKNYVTMFGQENIDKLAAATARIEELVEAKGAIDAVYAEMDAMLNKEGGITYDDSEAISQFKPRLDDLYVQYGIADQNYVDLATDAEAKYAELIVAYEAVIGEVVDLINTINDQLEDMKWLLSDGKKIQGIVDDLSRFIFEYEVTTVDLWLPGEGETLEVDLSDLHNKYNAAAANYKIQAKAAEAAAVEVNAAIEALTGVNAKDIKNNATVKAAYDKFVAWCDAYLADDIVEAGSVEAAIDEIQGVAVYGAKDTYYVFVSVTNYTNVVTAYNDANTAMTNAETAWNAIKADMATLIAGWDIHSYEDNDVNFVDVNTAYGNYLATYYDNTIDADTDVFGELDESAEVNAIAFKTEMDECKARLDAAQGVADAINAMIAALPEVTAENAVDVLATIAQIRGEIANYEATYCTDNCMFITEEFDNIFKLYQIEKFAEYAKAVNEAYAYADTEAEVENLNNRLAEAKQYIMEKATDIKGVDNAFSFCKASLDEYVASLKA